jgi:transcriptional regulator with XRE-family HTH domain
MPDLRSSSPAKRALAAELRRVREISGMSADEVAGRLRWSPSKISRIETNRTGVKTPDLNRLLDLYGVDEGQRTQLTALSREPEPRGWWNAYAESIPPEYAAYISLEEHAARVLCWSPELIHGLLQTEDYANAIMEIAFGSPPSISPRVIQDRIQVRLRRQGLLTSTESRHLTFILDEGTLLRRHGSAQVMRAQLARLVEVSRLPNVTVRVLAFAGAHPLILQGSFAVLQFEPIRGTAISDVVYVEELTRSDFVDEEAGPHEYRLAFERLADVALDPDESRKLIARTAAERWS